MTPADELRAAADKVAPETHERPTLTGEYPDLDACYAQIFRDTATACDAVTRYGVEPDETASWLAPALAAARAINGGQP
jgi:hypothetical protein